MEQLNSTESNSIFEVILHKYSIGLMIVGKLVWQQEEVQKKRYQCCSDNLGTIFYLRALQGHSGSNPIDQTPQDRVVIGSGIFYYIYHIGCAFNLHSMINNGLIPGGPDSSRRQTISSCPLIQETQIKNNLNILTSLYHVVRDTCTMHGRGIKTRYSGLILIFRSEND